MSTTREASSGRLAGLTGAAWRQTLLVAFTAVETAALAVWLALVTGAPRVSRTAALGLGVLAVGLVVEHVLTDAAVNGPSLSPPAGPILAFSASEALLWAVWLGVAERVGGLQGVAVAGVVLAALLVPQHTIEDNALRGADLLSRLFARGTVGFSLLEAAGATVWLALVRHPGSVGSVLAPVTARGITPEQAGLAALALALLVEHEVGLRFSRRE